MTVDFSGLDAVNDPRRLAAVALTGLDAAADEVFDRFTAVVCAALNVPVSLVTLVQADRQIFPGSLGLSEPWQQQRQTPLSHSFCQHVVLTAEPLVVTDARTDVRVLGNAVIEDLSVVAYCGLPLTGSAGELLGSLCAIDHQPRQWTDADLSLLQNLAVACTDLLQLRIAANDAAGQRALAEQARLHSCRPEQQLGALALSRYRRRRNPRRGRGVQPDGLAVRGQCSADRRGRPGRCADIRF